jgi:ATP diphosphatase
VGDLLFVVVNLARKLKIDPEVALEATNVKFMDRFHQVEGELKGTKRTLEEATLDEMEVLWQRAKERGRMA